MIYLNHVKRTQAKIGEIIKMVWIIQNKNDSDLAWSNSWGWCEDDFDTFSDEEKQSFNLPIEGRWLAISQRKGDY